MGAAQMDLQSKSFKISSDHINLYSAKVSSDLGPPAGVDLSADVGDLGEVPGGGSLADHLGAPALALDCGCRHPELVLGARSQL